MIGWRGYLWMKKAMGLETIEVAPRGIFGTTIVSTTEYIGNN